MARRKETKLEKKAMEFAREIIKTRKKGRSVGLAGLLKRTGKSR